MVKGVIFDKSDTSDLILRLADGTAIINTEFPTARIVGRRKYIISGNNYQFSEPAETVDLLYTSLEVDFSLGIFYASGSPTINDQSGTPDPIYSPTDLNGTNVTYQTNVNLNGITFKYEIAGDELKIVARGSTSNSIQTNIPITFTIPYFFLRIEPQGQPMTRYMANLSISTTINIAELPNSFPDSYITPTTNPTWTSANILFSNGKLSKENPPGDYDSVGFYSLPSVNGTTIKGYYSTVKFSNDGGYAYAGLTTSMTTTDPVGQYSSKIDAGFKNEAGGIMLVSNGAEVYVLGDYTSTYSVLYDGSRYIYYKDNISVNNTSASGITSGMKVGVAIYDGQNIDITGGTYSGSTIEIVSPVSVTDVVQIGKNINITLACNGTPSDYTIKLLNDQGVIQDTFSFSPSNDQVYSITIDQLTNFTGAPDFYKIVADAVYTNTTLTSGEYVFTSADLRPIVIGFTQLDERKLSIQWSSSAGVDDYSVYIGKYDATSDTYINITNSPFLIPGDTSTYIAEFDLQPGEQYKAYVTATFGSKTTSEGTPMFITIIDWREPYGVKNIVVDTTTVPGQVVISWENDDSTGYVVPVNHVILLLDDVDVVIESYNTSNSEVSLITSFNSYPVNIAKILINAVNNNTFNIPSAQAVLVGPWAIQGGGGGGGGGNNGGNGHNMALEFAYTGYEGAVSQTNTITVLGEEGGALTKDETIVVHVTAEELSKVLAYSSNWTTSGDAAGEQPRPNVKFRPVAAVGHKLTTMFNKLKVKGTGAADGDDRKWIDDSGASIPVFGNELLGLTFTNSALDDDELPREAIRKIEEGDITSDDLTTAVISDLASSDAGAPKALLEGLFEQAVSSSKVSTADASHPDEAGYKMPTFAVGDSISFLVKYNFSKVRQYTLDSDVASGNSTVGARTTITIAGQTFDISTGNETSDAFSKTYEIKLLAN
jgi:hypothetical protein